MNKPKMLAPVSNLKMAKTVLENGADIVYAGVKGWSLRPNMFEVEKEDLGEIIKLVKSYNKKIFLAMNCFYRSTEIPSAIGIIEHFYSLGIDGVITSEYGLISLIRKKFPDLQVHVSVQTSASSSIDMEFYKKMGVTSVVLPRDMLDLSIDNIRGLAGKGITIEVFAVGDDSTNYDGRCMLSAYLFQKALPDDSTGREELIVGNANRCGYCYLACKRKCSINGKTGKLLKRGDLSLHRRIPELIKAGVGVFKVQGREFPLHLVGKLIATFRGLLDNIDNPDKLSGYIRTMDDLVELKQIIASNHLWLLAKSQSPTWKKLRKYIEKPWDNLTTGLWLKGKGKDLIRKISLMI